jgi:hypothetical protein
MAAPRKARSPMRPVKMRYSANQEFINQADSNQPLTNVSRWHRVKFISVALRPSRFLPKNVYA